MVGCVEGKVTIRFSKKCIKMGTLHWINIGITKGHLFHLEKEVM